MKRAALLLATPVLLVVGASHARSAEARDSSPDREQYEKSMEERLRKVGQELDELRARVAAAAERTGKELRQQLAEAEQKQKAASRRLEKLRKESAKRWKKLAGEMNDAAADLEKSCERARSRFKE